MGSISVKQNSISLFPSILEDTNALFQYSARNGKKYKNGNGMQISFLCLRIPHELYMQIANN